MRGQGAQDDWTETDDGRRGPVPPHNPSLQHSFIEVVSEDAEKSQSPVRGSEVDVKSPAVEVESSNPLHASINNIEGNDCVILEMGDNNDKSVGNDNPFRMDDTGGNTIGVPKAMAHGAINEEHTNNNSFDVSNPSNNFGLLGSLVLSGCLGPFTFSMG
ncbi:hypothetical protein L2E82_05615 [Cichorium intybus]|uniref:Uncharacterized protein n=1 Tax=Cichorium intybus TaxID=13427 RepID=A0ACB9H7B0_CICIN|nr:hypothetical protein L2E82_05615 [Cichorium intybus]